MNIIRYIKGAFFWVHLIYVDINSRHIQLEKQTDQSQPSFIVLLQLLNKLDSFLSGLGFCFQKAISEVNLSETKISSDIVGYWFNMKK